MREHKLVRWFACLLLFVFAMAAADVSGERRLAPDVSLTTPREYFGLHVQRLLVPHDSGGYSKWPDIDFGSWRLWGAYVSWQDIQPQRGQWDFSRLDRYADIASARQISLMLTFGHTPRWASARPDEPCAFGTSGCSAEPADMSDWDAYVRKIVTRYKGRIAVYELWNEPKFSDFDPVPAGQRAGFFSGSLASLVEMSSRAAKIIREVDPSARIAYPAFDGGLRAAKKLDQFLRNGGKGVADIVALHLYAATPEESIAYVDAVRAVMAAHGMADAPLWNTEAGLAIERPLLGIVPGPRTGNFKEILAQDVASAYLVRSFLLNRAMGVERFYWFEWDADRPPLLPMGLAEQGGQISGKAGRAYSQVITWMLGARMEACTRGSSGLWQCNLRRADKTARVLWSDASPIDFQVPPSWGWRRERTGGTSLPIDESRRILVDGSPVMIAE